MNDRISITIGSKYHRSQFDDWLAGGSVEYRGKIYHWSADNSNYGFGWEIQPVCEEDWADISESEFDKLIRLIELSLDRHGVEYIF